MKIHLSSINVGFSGVLGVFFFFGSSIILRVQRGPKNQGLRTLGLDSIKEPHRERLYET